MTARATEENTTIPDQKEKKKALPGKVHFPSPSRQMENMKSTLFQWGKKLSFKHKLCPNLKL